MQKAKIIMKINRNLSIVSGMMAVFYVDFGLVGT